MSERRGELVRLHTERSVEQLPGAGIEHLEEAAVEHDAGGVALAPFDGQLSAVGEGRHAGCLGPDTEMRIMARVIPAVRAGVNAGPLSAVAAFMPGIQALRVRTGE